MSRRRKSPARIIAEANALAREFYRPMGYQVSKGYRFDKATHPQERTCWAFVKAAYLRLAATDLDDVVTELEEE